MLDGLETQVICQKKITGFLGNSDPFLQYSRCRALVKPLYSIWAELYI